MNLYLTWENTYIKNIYFFSSGEWCHLQQSVRSSRLLSCCGIKEGVNALNTALKGKLSGWAGGIEGAAGGQLWKLSESWHLVRPSGRNSAE